MIFLFWLVNDATIWLIGNYHLFLICFIRQSGSVVSGAYDGYWKHGAPTAQIHNTSPAQPHFQKPLEQKSSYDSFQDQQKTACPQGPSLQYPASHQVSHLSQSPQVPHLSQLPQVPQLNPVPQTYQSPVQTAPSLDTRRVNKLQIPTNPRIASNLTFGITKTDKDSSTISAAAKPAYVSVSLPKPNEKTPSSTGADSMLKVRILIWLFVLVWMIRYIKFLVSLFVGSIEVDVL